MLETSFDTSIQRYQLCCAVGRGIRDSVDQTSSDGDRLLKRNPGA